ncbi:hypothetical protein [Amycolatopsis nigrescens]|uniref:hypothetical protein n=1 Tax=Amycolatopsis nigrescens TaxID=381445 RepID=UPI000374F896|nr:hypothetical protein [Amycolatopsis nigrescens]
MVYQPQTPEYIRLPPMFVQRFRFSVILIGVALIVGALAIYGVTALLDSVLHDGDRGALVRVAGLLPPLSVLITAITLCTARRCLHGEYLVVARARRVRGVLLACLLIAFAAIALADLLFVLSDQADAVDLLFPLFFLLLNLLGYLAGSFFVRPSVRTLQRFDDRPIW